MTKHEIKKVLDNCLTREPNPQFYVENQDWNVLKKKFDCDFPKEFINFMELMPEFLFPGDILNVKENNNNGNDTISLTYDMERSLTKEWNADMIPFYFIGNGDYFCISCSEGVTSKVFYFFSERASFEVYCENFAIWIQKLPDFLKGE